MNRFLRLSVPFGTAFLVLVGGLYLVDASAASVQPAQGMEGNLLVTTLEDELNTDGDCSLREAIEAANTNAAVDACPAGDGVITDTIAFEVAGTITVTSQLSVTAGGPLVVGGGEVITVSGGGVTRVWWVEMGSEVTLQRLWVVDGTACLGGAIRNNGRLTILESTFTNNHSTGEECVGGAIANISAPLTVIDSAFAENSASGAGGAIFNSGGTVTVTNSTLSGNNAEVGGGIHNFAGMLAVTSSTLEENNANQAGGIANSLGTLKVIDSFLSGNSAIDGGGALGNWDGDVKVTNSILAGNNANGYLDGKGGAICNYTGTLEVADSTFSGNSAAGVTLAGQGGAIFNSETLTVTNSIFSGNSVVGGERWSGSGGAIYNDGTLIVIDSSLFDNTSTEYGGAIYNVGNFTVTNSTLSGNRAYTTGGAITNTGMLMIINSILSENDAEDGGGAISNGILLIVNNSTLSGNNASENGGAVYNYSALTIIDSTLSGNNAIENGGAIYNYNASLMIIDSTLSENNAIENGGAVYNDGMLTIIDSTLSESSAYFGGAIHNRDTLNVTNSTLSGNSAYAGGATYNEGVLTLTNSTLSGNTAVPGGAINNDEGSTMVTNSIVANSYYGNDCYVFDGAIIDGGHNISSDDTCGFDPVNGSMPNTDPLLGLLQDNGGATWTHALLDGSPAIDAGDDVQCPETDQHGIPRPQDGNGDGESVCDIGAYETELEIGVFLTPHQQSASARPGDTLVYIFRLYNYTQITDTFSLTLSPHAWETSLSTDFIGPIASGISQTFTTSVTIPWDAAWYLTDTVVITAASVTSPTIFFDTARITSQAYAPPEISISPQSLVAALFTGEAVTQTLTISNGNGVTLTFDIAEAANWLSVEPISGEVGTSSSVPVQVSMDAAGLPAGDYNTTLQVSSNDPDEPLIEVPVTMTVVDLPIEGLSAENDSPTLLGGQTTLSATVEAGTNVIYTWDFGDGELGSGQVVTHVYPAVDVYTTTVTATNSAGSVTATTLVIIQDVPIEGLMASNDSPTLLGEATTLSATVEAGTNVVYAWDFGDGETGSGQVVTHVYPAVDVYTATVTATNSAGSVTATTVVMIQDVPIEELMAFNDSPTLFGSLTTLSATVSTGTNVVFAWDFGDGEMGSGQVVMHTYSSMGIFTATVTATNTANSLTATTVVTITAETPSYWQYLPFTVKSQALEVESQAESQINLQLNWLLLSVAGVLCTAAQSRRLK